MINERIKLLAAYMTIYYLSSRMSLVDIVIMAIFVGISTYKPKDPICD